MQTKSPLFVLLFAGFIFGQNHAPSLASVSVYSASCADTVPVRITLADWEGDICTLSVEYSSDNGGTWFHATVKDPVFLPNLPSDSVYWISHADVGLVDLDSVKLRITPYDSDTGSSRTSNSFQLLNYSSHDFDPRHPWTGIISVTLNSAATASDTVEGTYLFQTSYGRTCSVHVYYSIDNGINWTRGQSNLTTAIEQSGTNTFKWYSRKDLPHYEAEGVRVKVVPVVVSNGMTGVGQISTGFRLDNMGPGFFWAGAKAGSNKIYLQFSDETDSAEIVNAARYSMNFGRSIVDVSYDTIEISNTAPITISYWLRAGPELPESTSSEFLHVYYLTSGNTWSLVRTIKPAEASTFTLFHDVITSPDAYHDNFRIKFEEPLHSGTAADNYYIDDITLANNTVIFTDSFPSSLISSSKWDTLAGISTSSSYRKSSSYAMSFYGNSRPRKAVTAAIPVNSLGYTCSYTAQTDANLIQDLSYTLEIDSLFDTLQNYSAQPAKDTFVCKADSLWPSLALNCDYDMLSATETISYQIINHDSGTMSIGPVEFLVPGEGWKPATIFGTIDNPGPGDYAGFLRWNTAADFPGKLVYGVKLRARVNDTATAQGPFGLLENLKINNNSAPSIVVSAPQLSSNDSITISYQITDPDNDSVSLEVSFSGNGTTYYPATTAGTITDIPAGQLGTFKWLWKEDIGTDKITGIMYIKVCPKDEAAGNCKKTTVFINSLQVPIIEITTPSGEQAGDITIPYVISDSDSDAITLQCYYSSGGSTWYPATVGGPTSGIQPAAYEGSLTWESATDLPGIYSTSVFVKIVPADSSIGIGDATNSFTIDNNEKPSCTLLPIAGTRHKYVSINALLSDPESDRLYLRLYYRQSGASTWQRGNITTPSPIDSAAYTNDTISFSWQSHYDLN
ncbi:MAG: hypothetical protein GF350_12055, partial [Chitinivibrionales bacterium]|nr:hypothetical protein [Chitinivibrionales bacterium]